MAHLGIQHLQWFGCILHFPFSSGQITGQQRSISATWQHSSLTGLLVLLLFCFIAPIHTCIPFPAEFLFSYKGQLQFDLFRKSLPENQLKINILAPSSPLQALSEFLLRNLAPYARYCDYLCAACGHSPQTINLLMKTIFKRCFIQDSSLGFPKYRHTEVLQHFILTLVLCNT